MLTELYGGSETLKDTIIAGNSASMEPDCHGGPTSDGYNLIGNTAGCSFTNTTGDKVNKNPRLDPLGSYGGPTQTMLDQGDQPGANAVPTSLCTVHSDQRGVHRHRIEDALSATRAAIEEGTVAGGGVALIRAEEAVDVDSLGLSGDEATGALIVPRSLQEPARLIAGNAAVVVERIRGEVDAMGLTWEPGRGETSGWPGSSTPPRSPAPRCRTRRPSRRSC
jgi:hypothetical protein